MSLPIALLIGVPTSGVALGIALGIGIALIVAAGAFRAHAIAVRERGESARALAEAHDAADERAATVMRQFEWAVNDVAKLREELIGAQSAMSAAAATAAEATRRVRELGSELADAQTLIAELTAKREAPSITSLLQRKATAKPSVDKRGRVYTTSP